MSNIPEMFGCMVFNDKVMSERLPEQTYKELKKVINEEKKLEIDVANVVASAMKDWAVEKGATHYTHWFQPMTGITAEKHDSFISPFGNDSVIMEFSGKELIKGEPDASSFPSGGLRATFEARGYTAWDPTSYAFIKDDTLCIPTAFCSYSGDVLDKKTPLLRSMNQIDKQAMRILRLLGNKSSKHVYTTVGAEQEYFLIDKGMYDKRKDLIFAGRTLFGAKAPKGQEMEDHYFGAIKPRVAAYMKELDEELWKLGILAKTEHNEVAPSQHELAPVFTTTNTATDHNQLMMEIMKKVALKHGLVCLLHEKPFAGVNGSGKHNNWSLCTDDGINLLNPGKNPENNLQFLLFVAAVIKGVDEYQDLLRISVSNAGNDCRLGGDEAPPAIVSMFLGDELEQILSCIENDEKYIKKERDIMETGVLSLPNFRKDTTDRNRTSPFAFTGNKFEFRMLGSSFSISCSNVILNTIVADALEQFALRLEKEQDKEKCARDIIKNTMKEHKRIIFNGNNYSDEWVFEAEKRGLLNLKTTPDALPLYVSKKNIELFERHGVYTEVEIKSRTEILLDNYCKVINIEALTMTNMARKQIIPAIVAYSGSVAKTANAKKKISDNVRCGAEIKLIERLDGLCDNIEERTEKLEEVIAEAAKYDNAEQEAFYYKDCVLPVMNMLREAADEAETIVSQQYWPYPTYGDLLFGVK